jgi:hypothetical protein
LEIDRKKHRDRVLDVACTTTIGSEARRDFAKR